MTNPYEADPDKIPATDLYADVPFYGRYLPKPYDFRVDFQHVNPHTAESLKYWASVVSLCTDENRIYPADEGGRDVFALDTVIVKSSHLHGPSITEIDYSYADSNEVQAIALAKTVLKTVRVPEIYFAGKIHKRQVLIQERLPGVGLSVARPYISRDERGAFKEQAREILKLLHIIKPEGNIKARSHVAEILFSSANDDPDVSFMHNDFTESNCIVDEGKIVGLVDWEMAGFFGWRTAGEVHRWIRTPQCEHFVHSNLSEDQLRDRMYWNDLYDQGMPAS
ncbi:hypothetical protein BDW74DRAFT_172683 [Aspergillus multicolor]|uniref:uncharacterized protein n=1 Tax=Aspergillus multicolor TaxID=41759 RepID=UPI003CCD06EA